ncbi:MAG: hypothetical protein HKN00_06520 [Flavobacteriaceae bacterium]|nr:hypothetical protein [Bacteroidia bacterium]NNF74819.1 hypothetical protein [Flavobacteriaceae bacterium]
MTTNRDILRRGLKYMAITVLLMFIGPSLLYVAFTNQEKPLYIPILVLALLLCGASIFMGFKGIRTILNSMFNQRSRDRS